MKSTLQLLEWPELLKVLARHAESPLGRGLAARLRPFTSLGDLQDAIAAVGEARGHLASGGISLEDARDLEPILTRATAKSAGLSGRDLYQVARTLEVAERVRNAFANAQAYPKLGDRVRRLPILDDLREDLLRSVDSSGEVPDEATPGLGDLRRQVEIQEREIRTLAERVSAKPAWRSVLRGGPPVLRDGRYMLAVKAESRGRVRGLLHDRSASGATAFVEPEELVEPQNRLADLRARERREVAAVLNDLSRRTARRAGEIRESTILLGRVDLILARARYLEDVQSTLVVVGESGSPWTLYGARHPLLLERERYPDAGDLDRARRRVVPFDLSLGEDFDLLVVTGPNTGGKTATLKAVGLITLMAHCAIPVPVAAGSKVPWVDAVHIDVGDEQDLQQNLSTFSGHLRRIAGILEAATDRSLVLLDELGSGTDPREGEALGAAVLEHLLGRRSRVIATTHLSRLKELGFEHERAENASLEFDPVTLKPLFRLTQGLPGESNAVAIARRLGIPGTVLQAAEMKLRPGGSEDLQRATEQLQRSRVTALRHLEKAAKEEHKLSERREQLEARLTQTEERARLLESEKQKELDRVLAQARDRGRRLLRELGTVPRSIEAKIRKIEEFIEGLGDASPLAGRRRAYILSRQKGDEVYLPRFREHGRVQKIDRAREIVTVLYRSLPMELAFDEIACPDEFELPK